MTLEARVAGPGPLAPEHYFGGGRSPYDAALAAGGGLLHLVEAEALARYDSTRNDLALPFPDATLLDVGLFTRPAGAAERRLLSRAAGPLLDVGCGPGRIVRAAIDRGLLALGVDVSRTAVSMARGAGLPVLLRSAFQPLPAEGKWAAATLLDGNLGIGGDPVALLRRCGELLHPRGSVLVEAHPDDSRDRAFAGVILDARGGRSRPFPWAEAGIAALGGHAEQAGLRMRDSWLDGGRRFAELTRA